MTTTPDNTYAIGQLVKISTPNKQGLQYEGFEEGVIAEVCEKRTVPQVASPPSSKYTGIGIDTEYRVQRVVLRDVPNKFGTPNTPAQYIHHSSLSQTPNGSPSLDRQYLENEIVYILKDLSVTVGRVTYRVPKGSPAATITPATSRSGRVSSRDSSTWYYRLSFMTQTPKPKTIKTPVFIHHDRLIPLPQGAQRPKEPVAGNPVFVPPEA